MFKYFVLLSLLFASSAYAERTLKTWGNLFAEDTCHEQSKVLKFSQGSCYKHATTGKMMRKVCMEHCSLLNLFDYACALSPKGNVVNHWAPNHHICQDYEASSTAIFHVKDGSTTGCGHASVGSASCSPSGPWTSSSYCGASHFEYKECEWKVPVQPCTPPPVDCVVTPWGQWSTECVAGKQTRTRTIHVHPQNGGASCPPLSETRDCTLCEVGPWSEFSVCDTVKKTQFRTRNITVHPVNTVCSLPLTETRSCDPPVNCVVGQWSNFTKCIGGKQTRTRSILVHPAFGGVSCPPLVEEKECKLFFPETGCGLELQISQCRLDLTKTSTVCTIPGTNFTITVPTQDVHGFNRFRIRLLVRGEYKV